MAITYQLFPPETFHKWFQEPDKEYSIKSVSIIQ